MTAVTGRGLLNSMHFKSFHQAKCVSLRHHLIQLSWSTSNQPFSLYFFAPLNFLTVIDACGFDRCPTQERTVRQPNAILYPVSDVQMSDMLFMSLKSLRKLRLVIHDSKKVKRLVCRMFNARSASRSSITQEMLISLAPTRAIQSARPVDLQPPHRTYLVISSQCSHCSPRASRTSFPRYPPCSSSASQQD